MIAPMIRVDNPHDVSYTLCSSLFLSAYLMSNASGKNFRRNGLSPTVKPDRRASALQSYKCPALPQIFHFLFFFRQQPESQDFLLQSLYILSTLILYVLPLLHMSHESYDLPARGIPLNEGTVLSFSPNEEPSTTDSILSEGLCKTEPSCSTRHRTMSQMSDGYRISPEAAPLRRVLPTLLQARTLRCGLFLSAKGFPGSKPEDIRFPHLCL